MSKREDIHAALFDLLDAIVDVPAERNPQVPVDWDALDAATRFIALLDGAQTPPRLENSAEMIRTMTPALEGYVRDDDPTTISTKLEALRVLALQAVLADRTLGGLAWDVREGELEQIEVNRENESGPSGAFRQLVEVDYVTRPREF